MATEKKRGGGLTFFALYARTERYLTVTMSPRITVSNTISVHIGDNFWEPVLNKIEDLAHGEKRGITIINQHL